jgi:hypothetical protein
MKTYEDWIEQQDPTKTIPLKDAWNAAIETMRQDCEPVLGRWVFLFWRL